MERLKKQKGITLIALIITIIVMLILVGITVTVSLNGGLFSTAEKAAGDTETERDKELALSDGTIEINGKKYDSYQQYVDDKSVEPEEPTIDHNGATIPEGAEYLVCLDWENSEYASEKLVAGDAFPTTLSTNDCYYFGDFQYVWDEETPSWGTVSYGWQAYCTESAKTQTSVTLLSSIQNEPVKMYGPFYGCTLLEHIYYEGTKAEFEDALYDDYDYSDPDHYDSSHPFHAVPTTCVIHFSDGTTTTVNEYVSQIPPEYLN